MALVPTSGPMIENAGLSRMTAFGQKSRPQAATPLSLPLVCAAQKKAGALSSARVDFLCGSGAAALT